MESISPVVCMLIFGHVCKSFGEAAVRFVLFARPSDRMAQLGYHWTDFSEI
jgi:hypothetical protein